MEKIQSQKLLNDERGVFGLTSVQAFFAIILSIALLGYVIVVIMGTLQDSNVIDTTETINVVNETGYINNTGYTLAGASFAGFINPTITIAVNATVGNVPTNNYTVTSAGVVRNTSVTSWNLVNFTYSYSRFTARGANVANILGNTSGGVTSFYSSINPVYAILAILVIILVLVVLVRVVSGGNQSGTYATSAGGL